MFVPSGAGACVVDVVVARYGTVGKFVPAVFFTVVVVRDFEDDELFGPVNPHDASTMTGSIGRVECDARFIHDSAPGP